MVRPAITPFAPACAVAAFLAATGCSDSSGTTGTSGEYPTLLTIDPLLFRGTLPCGAPGLERYVATVTDLSVDAASPVASSLPTPCQSPVSFGETVVAIYHYYTAVIDGYDRNDIGPAEPGQRQMFDADKNLVLPAWTTTCGELPGLIDSDKDAAPDEDAEAAAGNGITPYMRLRAPTFAIGQVDVVMHGCLPLVVSPMADASVPDASVPDASEPDASEPDASPANSSAFAARASVTISPIHTRVDSLNQAKLDRAPPHRHGGDGEEPSR
jgi:hypothetical protein